MPSEPLGPLLRSGPPCGVPPLVVPVPPRVREVRVPALPLTQSQGGTTLTMKSSKTQKAKSLDKLGGHLPSKPAAAVESLGTHPVPRALITATVQHSLVAAVGFPLLIEVGFPVGIPWFLLKPPTPITSGFLAWDSPFPGASKPASFEVASPRGEPLRAAVSGVPLETGDALAQSVPDPPLGESSLTHVSGMGGGEGLFTPLGPGLHAR
jgi:hypothetical protein